MRANTLESILERCESQSDCILWPGTTTKGYGRAKVEGKNRRLHKYVYTRIVGAIDDNLVLDHLCRNRNCLNPTHLEPVTNYENLLRGNTLAALNLAKTHCPKGHEYTPKNTGPARAGGYGRACRACKRAYWHSKKGE